MITHSALLQVSFTDHSLKPFAGLEVCISGFVLRDVKAKLGKEIVGLGAHYNPDLNRATCHVLVCEQPFGQKYR